MSVTQESEVAVLDGEVDGIREDDIAPGVRGRVEGSHCSGCARSGLGSAREGLKRLGPRVAVARVGAGVALAAGDGDDPRRHGV